MLHTRQKHNPEASLIYNTTSGKVELEHNLHSIYTFHSALQHSRVTSQKLKSHIRYKAYNIGEKNILTGSNVDMVLQKYNQHYIALLALSSTVTYKMSNLHS